MWVCGLVGACVACRHPSTKQPADTRRLRKSQSKRAQRRRAETTGRSRQVRGRTGKLAQLLRARRMACGISERCAAGPIAQRLEQRTHNPLVPGSNPGGPTNTRQALGRVLVNISCPLQPATLAAQGRTGVGVGVGDDKKSISKQLLTEFWLTVQEAERRICTRASDMCPRNIVGIRWIGSSRIPRHALA